VFWYEPAGRQLRGSTQRSRWITNAKFSNRIIGIVLRHEVEPLKGLRCTNVGADLIFDNNNGSTAPLGSNLPLQPIKLALYSTNSSYNPRT
jgi:hypothetical protein